MNPDFGNSYSYLEKSIKDRLFEREEKLKKAQTYKKKNQKHPAFK